MTVFKECPKAYVVVSLDLSYPVTTLVEMAVLLVI